MAYVASLTDEELDAWIATAHADTVKAGAESQEGDWYEACFCALLLLSQEKNRRTAKRMH